MRLQILLCAISLSVFGGAGGHVALGAKAATEKGAAPPAKQNPKVVPPSEYKRYYGIDWIHRDGGVHGGITGRGQTIAVLGLDKGLSETNVRTYFRRYRVSNGRGKSPHVETIGVKGPSPEQDGENEADQELAGMVAPGATIKSFILTARTDEATVAKMNQALKQILADPKISIVTTSYSYDA
jgi:hypothetical protein